MLSYEIFGEKMKKRVLLSLLVTFGVAVFLGWKYKNLNINDIPHMLFNISETEKYKVQMIELEYLLMNRGVNIKTITDKSIEKDEKLLERNYNYLQVTYDDNSTTLSFMDIAKNGQKTNLSLKGKYFEMIDNKDGKKFCKTNLSNKDISSWSFNISEICSEVVEVRDLK